MSPPSLSAVRKSEPLDRCRIASEHATVQVNEIMSEPLFDEPRPTMFATMARVSGHHFVVHRPIIPPWL